MPMPRMRPPPGAHTPCPHQTCPYAPRSKCANVRVRIRLTVSRMPPQTLPSSSSSFFLLLLLRDSVLCLPTDIHSLFVNKPSSSSSSSSFAERTWGLCAQSLTKGPPGPAERQPDQQPKGSKVRQEGNCQARHAGCANVHTDKHQDLQKDAIMAAEAGPTEGPSGYTSRTQLHSLFLNKPLNRHLSGQLPPCQPSHEEGSAPPPAPSPRVRKMLGSQLWAVVMVTTVICSLAYLPTVEAAPKSQSQPITRAALNFVSPTASSSRASGSKRQPEVNFNPRASARQRFMDGASATYKKRKRGAQGPLAQVNIMEWNVGGLKSESDTWSYLNHIETEWPDMHLVVLTESHLLVDDINTELSANETWEAHHLHQHDSSYTNWGGIVLLARKGMFTVRLQQEFQDYYLDAAIWEVDHDSWEHPLQLTGYYRNQPAGKNQGGAATQTRADVESTQMAALHRIGKAMNAAQGPALALGDLNIALGKLQEVWSHNPPPTCRQRISQHDPHITPSSLAHQMMAVVNTEHLMILNGRFGNGSASTTYEKNTRTNHGVLPAKTTIDYALCRQNMQSRILDMTVEKKDGAGALSDHSPISVSLQCTLRPPGQAKNAPTTQWLNPVDRGLLDMAPISTPDWEEAEVGAKYQSLLRRHLVGTGNKLVMLRAQQKKTLSHPAGSRPANEVAARQKEWSVQIDEIYEELTSGILTAAAECLPRKKTPSLQGGLRTKPRTSWRPDAEWHKLKLHTQTEWLKHKDTPHDHTDYLLSKQTYKQACRDLRVHTSRARSSWLSRRLQNTSLLVSSHKVKLTWAKLKRSLGSESASGLPAQVRGDDGAVLQGKEAAAEWHKKRSAIGRFDATAPFDQPAQSRRKLLMKSIQQKEETDAARASLPNREHGAMDAAITMGEIDACLQRASTNTAPGTDEIYNELLKQGGDYLRDLLLTFFNAVWEAETGPEEWSLALVRPLYKPKTKDPLSIESYRAITLINTICKLYEDVLCDRVVTHLEASKGISPGQAGSRRFLGCQEMVYTLMSTARLRKEHLKEGTYCCFIDLKLAYPSTDHDVIFSKLHSKGVQGRLFRNIRALYKNMRSRVIHPEIADDDYFNIEVGAREGSVLSPILFLVAIDDMAEYLAARPFHQKAPSSSKRAKQRLKTLAAPGVWVGSTYLALLQYVDDAVLLARSPEELQHMINVIAEYCAENRLVLNPKEGKTEVVEFMCEPSGTNYDVASPKSIGDPHRARIHVKQGYQYLGWYLDKELTLQEHTQKLCRLLVGAAARVVGMGGRPGALPVRTTFMLWSSLALSHVHGGAALLSPSQVDRLQRKMRAAVRQMAGRRAEPAAVLADMGIPDAVTIASMRSVGLLMRLRTLPQNIAPASLHRFIMALPHKDRASSFENGMLETLQLLQLPDMLQETARPPASLLVSADAKEGGIKAERQRWSREIKKRAWSLHCKAMLAEQSPFDSDKMRAYTTLARRDIQRREPHKCAAYLKMELSSKQESALLQLRCGGSLLAIDDISDDTPLGADHRCSACVEHLGAPDTVLEDHYHALYDCCKPPLKGRREQWAKEMQQVLMRWKVGAQAAGGVAKKSQLRWLEVEEDLSVQIALGVILPAEWTTGSDARHRRPLRKTEREDLHAELVATAAPYLVDLCKGLRDYQLKLLQGLEAGDPNFEALFLLLDEAADMAEHSPEQEEEA